MESSTKNVLVAAGAGLAIGAIVGVLFAPAKGTETRSAISDKYNDLKDKVIGDKSAEELLSQLKESAEKALKTNTKSAKDALLEEIKALETSLKS